MILAFRLGHASSLGQAVLSNKSKKYRRVLLTYRLSRNEGVNDNVNARPGLGPGAAACYIYAIRLRRTRLAKFV